VSHDYQDGLADLLDVVGQNYRENELLAAHAEKPTRKIIGTETTHERAAWLAMRDHPEFSGQFLWAGVNYLGESRQWPLIGDDEGFYDRTDRAKPDGLERESWWSESPVVHIARRVAPTQKAPTDPGYEAQQYRPAPVVFADWSPTDRSAHDENVEVYSNCETVELFLNGKSLGSLPRNADDSARKWKVPFAAGELKAVGSNHGVVVATETQRTAGKPAELLLTVERARLSTAWDDVGYVRATVADAQGTPVPDATNALKFSVSGPGKILTTDNADNADDSGFQKPERNAYEGTAIAILRATAATGNVVVHVSAEGLKSAAVSLPILPVISAK
jgi:beta-galactosidase